MAEKERRDSWRERARRERANNQGERNDEKEEEPEKKDPFAVLGLPKTATLAEVRKAYHKLALLWHPDKSKDPDAAAKMTEINEAMKDCEKILSKEPAEEDFSEDEETKDEEPKEDSEEDEAEREERERFEKEFERRTNAKKKHTQKKQPAAKKKNKVKKNKKKKKAYFPRKDDFAKQEEEWENYFGDAAFERCQHPVVVAMAVGSRSDFCEMLQLTLLACVQANRHPVLALSQLLDGQTFLHFAAYYDARYAVETIIQLSAEAWPQLVLTKNAKGLLPHEVESKKKNSQQGERDSAVERLKFLTEQALEAQRKERVVTIDWTNAFRRGLQVAPPVLLFDAVASNFTSSLFTRSLLIAASLMTFLAGDFGGAADSDILYFILSAYSAFSPLYLSYVGRRFFLLPLGCLLSVGIASFLLFADSFYRDARTGLYYKDSMAFRTRKLLRYVAERAYAIAEAFTNVQFFQKIFVQKIRPSLTPTIVSLLVSCGPDFKAIATSSLLATCLRFGPLWPLSLFAQAMGHIIHGYSFFWHLCALLPLSYLYNPAAPTTTKKKATSY